MCMAREQMSAGTVRFLVRCEPKPRSRAAIKARESPREPLQAAGRALAQQLPHHQRQIESAQVNQHPLENIFSPPQVHTPHAARFVSVREATFQQLSAPPQQFFSMLATNPPPVAV